MDKLQAFHHLSSQVRILYNQSVVTFFSLSLLPRLSVHCYGRYLITACYSSGAALSSYTLWPVTSSSGNKSRKALLRIMSISGWIFSSPVYLSQA